MADDDFVPGFPTTEPVAEEKSIPAKPIGIEEPPLLSDEPEDEAPDEGMSDEEADEEGVLETIEVEIEGKKYLVPKDVEPHLLRQEDYTQKTQTLADRQAEFEARQTQLQEKMVLQEAVLDDIAAIKGIDAQLGEYHKIDWPAYQLQNPQAAQYHWMQFQQLRDMREQAAGTLNEKMQHVSQLQQRSKDEAIQKAITALQKPDPEKGWPGYSASYLEKLTDNAVRVGFKRSQLEKITDPESIKFVNLAVIGANYLKQQAAASKAPKTVEAQPVKQVPANRGRRVPSSSGDELTADQWRARELAKEAKKLAALNGR
jgi:hypothetical protein